MTQIYNEKVEINDSLDVSGDVDIEGNLQLGSFDNGMMATEDALIEAHRSASSSLAKRGLHLLGALTGSLNNAVSWTVHELALTGSGALDALHTALRVKLSNDNTGTNGVNAELRGADIEIVNTGDTTNAVPAVTGMNLRLSNGVDGTINEAVLLNLEAVNDGTITDLYALTSTGGGKVKLDVLGKGLVQSDASGELDTLESASGTTGQVPTLNGSGDLVWGDVAAGLTLEDEASSPLSIADVTTIIVPEGALTDNGNGSATLDFAVGGSGAGSIFSSRIISQATTLQAGDQGVFVDYMALSGSGEVALSGDAVIALM